MVIPFFRLFSARNANGESTTGPGAVEFTDEFGLEGPQAMVPGAPCWPYIWSSRSLTSPVKATDANVVSRTTKLDGEYPSEHAGIFLRRESL